MGLVGQQRMLGEDKPRATNPTLLGFPPVPITLSKVEAKPPHTPR